MYLCMKRFIAGLSVLVVAGISSTTPDAESRPLYFNKFKADYPKLAEEVQKVKCDLCHDAKNKKVRNAYGKAVEKSLTKPNEKNEQVISNALKNAEASKSESGKTFGQMIEAGELPK